MNQIDAPQPANFDEKYKNTFYAGASTIPGAGLPMAIISSKLAFERIKRFSNKIQCPISSTRHIRCFKQCNNFFVKKSSLWNNSKH